MRRSASGLAVVLAASRILAGFAYSAEGPTKPFDFDEVETAAIKEARADDRRLVTAAPKGFKPKARARMLSIKLTARDSKIKVGESFWYRLEIQNVGSSVITYSEYDSFLKDGSDTGLRWRFYVTPPNGAREWMGGGPEELHLSNPANRAVEIPGSASMSKVEIETFILKNEAWRKADSQLSVTLAPGQTLSSRPWKWEPEARHRKFFIHRDKPTDRPKYEGFREFWTGYRFRTPGRYEITVVLNDPAPPPPNEEFLRLMEQKGVSRERSLRHHQAEVMESLGIVSSNKVAFEVVK